MRPDQDLGWEAKLINRALRSETPQSITPTRATVMCHRERAPLPTSLAATSPCRRGHSCLPGATDLGSGEEPWGGRQRVATSCIPNTQPVECTRLSLIATVPRLCPQ